MVKEGEDKTDVITEKSCWSPCRDAAKGKAQTATTSSYHTRRPQACADAAGDQSRNLSAAHPLCDREAQLTGGTMAANGSPERRRRVSGMYRRGSNLSEYV